MTGLAHMRAALSLAERGLGQVAPNPAVGCVLVSPDDQIVGRGWTQKGFPKEPFKGLLETP